MNESFNEQYLNKKGAKSLSSSFHKLIQCHAELTWSLLAALPVKTAAISGAKVVVYASIYYISFIKDYKLTARDSYA